MSEVQEITFRLPNKKVYVKPIKGRRSWLPKNHAAQFLFGDCHRDYIVPLSERSGSLVEPLTQEERLFFEDKRLSGMNFEPGDLSIHKKDDNYWNSFKVILDDGNLELDLSKPLDYLKYKVLLANTNEICPDSDKDSVERKWEYKYYISEEKVELKQKATTIDNIKEAYRIFGKMSSSSKNMVLFLKQYKLEKPSFKKFVPDDAKEEFLKVEINNIIEKDIHSFLSINNDPLYDDKKLLIEGLEIGAIEIVGKNYQTPEGTFLGETATEAIKYLNASVNNKVKLQVIGRIENAK